MSPSDAKTAVGLELTALQSSSPGHAERARQLCREGRWLEAAVLLRTYHSELVRELTYVAAALEAERAGCMPPRVARSTADYHRTITVVVPRPKCEF